MPDSATILIDSHCHLDAAVFDADREQVIARARAVGVQHIIVPAVTAASWPGLSNLCAGEHDLHAAYGLHPMFLQHHQPEHLTTLRALLEKPNAAIAIGECGLDFFHSRDAVDDQLAYFRGQLHLAKEFDLPVIVHARRALEEVILELRASGGLRGVVHSFSGSLEQAKRLWGMGFHLGIGGPITYTRATRLRSIIAQMPISNLLLETDAPDQADANHRGQRNEPAFITQVLEVIAKLRNDEPANIAAATSHNACQLFALAQD